jgi:hypothetical protein
MSNIKRLQEDFNYYFDDLHGDIVLAGITFSASDILYNMDPVAYNQEFMNYIDDIEVDIYAE